MTRVDHFKISMNGARRSDKFCSLDKLNMEKPTPMKDMMMAPPYTSVPPNDDFCRITSPTCTHSHKPTSENSDKGQQSCRKGNGQKSVKRSP